MLRRTAAGRGHPWHALRWSSHCGTRWHTGCGSGCRAMRRSRHRIALRHLTLSPDRCRRQCLDQRRQLPPVRDPAASLPYAKRERRTCPHPPPYDPRDNLRHHRTRHQSRSPISLIGPISLISLIGPISPIGLIRQQSPRYACTSGIVLYLPLLGEGLGVRLILRPKCPMQRLPLSGRCCRQL